MVSSAADATLTVADPSPTAPGHLLNGGFSLPQALQVRAPDAFTPIGATPLTLRTWTAPMSNEPVQLEFKQAIGARDALRTGTYSKTFTFTLSTTNP